MNKHEAKIVADEKTGGDPGTLAIVVSSCDRYQGIWPAFFELFRRFWPECPYPVYLGSNTVTCAEPGVTTVLAGPDVGWSETNRAFIEQVPAEYILWFLDDFLLCEEVDGERVAHMLAEAVALEADYLRMRPSPPPDEEVPGHPDIGRLAEEADYRCSLGVAIWRRDTFLELLRDGESPWAFETQASLRSRTRPGFYSVKEQVITRLNALEKGEWLRSGLPFLRSAGIDPEASGIPVMSRTRYARFWLRGGFLNVVESRPLRPLWELFLSAARPLKRMLRGG